MDKYKDKFSNVMGEAKDKLEDIKDKAESTLDDAKYIIENKVEDAVNKSVKGLTDVEDKIEKLKKKF